MRDKLKIITRKGQEGFSLPLTLLIGLIVTSSLMGAVYMAINSNQRTRFDFLRFLGRTGLDSLRTQYKTLLNDTDGGNIYNYFWLADGCSKNTPSKECPTPAGATTALTPGTLQNPSITVWPDGVWKQGPGRQKAPMCKPNTNQSLDWLSPHRAIQQTFYQKGIRLNPGVEPTTTGFVHSYTTNEISTTGTSRQQLISLVGGDKGGVNKAGRSAMVNLQIARIMSQAGFAFISAGYNGNEREPLALSNLKITGDGRSVAEGSILLRKNVFSPNDCGTQISQFRTTYSRSPVAGTSQYGGLTIFPAKFPSDLGSHPKNSGSVSNQGTRMYRKGDNDSAANQLAPGLTYQYDDLYLLPGSKLEINTSRPVTLKVKGDIHIAPGAKICNVSAYRQPCGSGKASQLTIVQGSSAEATSQVSEKVQCDIGSRANYQHTGEARPISSDGRTFTVQGTGRNNESLNAFIFAPSSTFVSAGVAKSSRNQGRYQWIQDHFNGHDYAVIEKGGYLKIARRSSPSSATLYRLLDESGRDIPASDAKKRGYFYTGIGQARNLPYNARRYPIYIPNNIILRHNLNTGRITTHGLTFSPGNTIRIQRERPIQYRNLSRRQVCQRYYYRCRKSYSYRCRKYRYWGWYSYWYWGTCYSYYWGSCYYNRCYYQDYWQTQTLIQSNIDETQMPSNTNGLNQYYNIHLMKMADQQDIANSSRRFKGAVWARNVCFSREDANSRYRRDWINTSTPHSWEFSSTFIDEMVSRYGQEYNFGLPEYRAQSETLVDPQRILSK